MLGSKRVLAIIPARGGSKGLPGKNTALCGGKPLIAWSIEAARGSRYVDRAIVTTDDEEILAAARALGGEAPFVRPKHLASDDALMDGVVLHAIDALGEGFDYGVLLQATSPLRQARDIDAALETMERLGAVSLASVTEPSKSPYWMHGIGPNGRLTSLFGEGHEAPRRRQDLPKAYALNGAVFAFAIDWFRERRKFVCEETAAYIMPEDRSIDVDTGLDLTIADLLLRRAENEASR